MTRAELCPLCPAKAGQRSGLVFAAAPYRGAEKTKAKCAARRERQQAQRHNLPSRGKARP